MTKSYFPHPSGMQSFWRTETGPLDNFRSTEELPVEADIVLIGGGYSSAAILTHILADPASKGKSIVVLEARSLCSGATGRNGGHLKPDSYNMASELAKRYGLEYGAEVAEFEAANVKAVAEFVAAEKIDCDLVLTRAIDVQLTEELDRDFKARYDYLVAAGVSTTKDTFYIPPKYAGMVSGVHGAKSAFSYTAGHLWPYKLTHHLFSKALQHKAVSLQTNTPVTSKKVLVTTNGYTASILPEYKDKIIPYRTVCCHIATPKDKTAPPLLNNTYAIRFGDGHFDYLIPRPDGTIVVGGAGECYIGTLDEWYDNIDDSKVISNTREYFDGYMQRHFRGWEDSGAYVESIWAGIMGFSSDHIPRIGPVPGRQGMFIFAGFTGHGMPQIFLSSKGLASMVLHNTPFQKTGLPRLFEETKERLASKENLVLESYKDFKKAQKAKL